MKKRVILTVCVAALICLTAGSAQAATVQEIFAKYGLLGFLAVDCSKEVSRDNDYYVHRPVDADHLQRDVMEGPTSVTSVIMIDQVAEVRPNEISVGGTQDGKPYTSIYRVEPNRTRVLEAKVGGNVEVAGGRMANGGETPWHNNCAAPPQQAQTPPADAQVAAAPPQPSGSGFLGMDLANLTPDLRARYKINDSIKGVVIVGVDARSAAAEKRLAAGEVIIEAGEERVSDLAQVHRVIGQLESNGSKSALLLVSTADGTVRYLALPMQ
jgi:hypothetical protein